MHLTFRIPSLRFATVKMPAPENRLRAFSRLIAVKGNLDPCIASADRAGCLNLNQFLYSKLQTSVWPVSHLCRAQQLTSRLTSPKA
jgi:hypothetical protein